MDSAAEIIFVGAPWPMEQFRCRLGTRNAETLPLVRAVMNLQLYIVHETSYVNGAHKYGQLTCKHGKVSGC